ncbi:unnamed protein product [Candida verbasci]|uniref:Cell wall mannoprotein PIR1-like C-terminal domain-containing protein n=1 Tax=Candida verbasci TaxID=1227364 RepID=A0A9W4XHZ7_9ASCO|nr:unnamed protein product [Candida verbasci]
MKFITSITLIVSAALTSAAAIEKREAGGYDDYKPTKTYDNNYDGGYITTFPSAFALAVKEYCDNDKYHGKHKGYDTDLDLVYEIDDGQLIYDDCHKYKPYPIDTDCETDCEDNDHKKKKHHRRPNPIDIDADCDTDCETDCEDKDHKKKKHQWKVRSYENDDYETDNEDYEPFRAFKHPFLKIRKNQHDTFFKLRKTVLKTLFSKKIVEIVANHQLQADFPVQPDALFTKGFSIVYKHGDWVLALNKSTKFYNSAINPQKSAFKIYDAPITNESKAIELVIIVIY